MLYLIQRCLDVQKLTDYVIISTFLRHLALKMVSIGILCSAGFVEFYPQHSNTTDSKLYRSQFNKRHTLTQTHARNCIEQIPLDCALMGQE
jgi:hypothetical protein